MTCGRFAIVLAAALAGCAGIAASSDSSPTGTGGSNAGCTTTACLPVASPPSSWMIEVAPPSNVDAGVTVISPPPALTSGAVVLTADSQTTVTATFDVPMNATVPASGTVILTVPSSIPGRPDLSFQTPAVPSTSSLSGSLSVPSKMVGAGGSATLSFVPTPPADQQSPPFTTNIPILGPMLETPIATDNFTISGVLETAAGTVSNTSFLARAFQGSGQVSSAPMTSAADGSFQLLLPGYVAAAGQPPLTIQLTPQTQTDGWFVFNPITLSSSPPLGFSLGTVLLSAYYNLSQFNVLVVGADQTRVNGANLSARTTLGTSTSTNMYKGTTSFGATGVSDVNGIAVLSLFPANGGYLGQYDLVAVPPAGSPWATTCLPSQTAQLAKNGSVTVPGAQTLTTLTLDRRPVLTGTVTDTNGRPVAGVAITAKPSGDPTGKCPSTPAASGSTATDAQGKFTLPLDPDVYQLDYDPPSTSAAPRYTETGVQVSGTGTVSHNRMLPRGSLLSGSVVTTSHDPVPAATIKLFQPQCTGVSSPACSPPPLLVGQGLTDAQGHFQIVVPMNP